MYRNEFNNTCAHAEQYTRVSNSSADYTDIGLLRNTQSYLQLCLRRQVPDSVLTEAWQEFYGLYSNLIRRFVIALGMRNVDIDDCIQEVWTEVTRRLSDFQHPEHRPGLRAWLYTIVRSKVMDLFRHKARHPAQSLSDSIEAGNEPRDNEPDSAALYERHWESARIKALLAELRTQVSELNYRVLHMRFLTPEKVRYRHHRMLRKLRAQLAHKPEMSLSRTRAKMTPSL
jgi:RNA polymerase sigma factor (sigma-70 family)